MILLDYRDRRPIYEQIVEKFRELMVSGALEQDAQMPSVRGLAMELSINPNTIQRAYMELERQGYIYSVKGRGSFVTDQGHIREREWEALVTEQSGLARRAALLGLDKEKLTDAIDKEYAGREKEKEEGAGQ